MTFCRGLAAWTTVHESQGSVRGDHIQTLDRIRLRVGHITQWIIGSGNYSRLISRQSSTPEKLSTSVQDKHSMIEGKVLQVCHCSWLKVIQHQWKVEGHKFERYQLWCHWGEGSKKRWTWHLGHQVSQREKLVAKSPARVPVLYSMGDKSVGNIKQAFGNKCHRKVTEDVTQRG